MRIWVLYDLVNMQFDESADHKGLANLKHDQVLWDARNDERHGKTKHRVDQLSRIVIKYRNAGKYVS